MTDKQIFDLIYKLNNSFSLEDDEVLGREIQQAILSLLVDIRNSVQKKQKVHKRPTNNPKDIIVGKLDKLK